MPLLHADPANLAGHGLRFLPFYFLCSIWTRAPRSRATRTQSRVSDKVGRNATMGNLIDKARVRTNWSPSRGAYGGIGKYCAGAEIKVPPDNALSLQRAAIA